MNDKKTVSPPSSLSHLNRTAHAVVSEPSFLSMVGVIGTLVVITLVGGWLRFLNIAQDSLWFDELISLQQAREPFFSLLRAVSHDVHPPLWPLLLKTILPFGDSAFVLRFLPAFFGTLSIPLLYLVGRSWFSPAAGLLAAILLAVSPFHIWHSQDARMYTQLMFVGMLSWYYFFKLLNRPRAYIWVCYVFASAAILYTHYYGALLLVAQLFVVATLRARGVVSRQFVATWTWAAVITGSVFVPWVLFALANLEFSRVAWVTALNPFAQLGFGIIALSSNYWAKYWEAIGLPVVPAALMWSQAIIFLTLGVLAVLRRSSKHWRSLWEGLQEMPMLITVAWFIVPTLLILLPSLAHPLLLPRYLLMTAPAFFLLVAVGLTRDVGKGWLLLASSALILCFVPSLLWRLQTPRTVDYKGATAFIAEHAEAGDTLVILGNHPHLRAMMAYYLSSADQWTPLRVCPSSAQDLSIDTVMACIGEAPRLWIVIGQEIEGMPIIEPLTAIEAKFKPVSRYSFHRVDVLFDERR